ncbi:mitochondrial carrier domain-containing protein [Lipomyces oligophaga]|uniref:mitochondrial carrier domain-containing protein n=1 Tax=Lipomyces oligophaga TaxID=45792 RepID=UPI0034CE22C5
MARATSPTAEPRSITADASTSALSLNNEELAKEQIAGAVSLQKEYSTAVSAALSSLVSTFVGFPFDSVKTRMQAYKFKSVFDCVSVTKRTEGVQGFFRGVGAPMISVSIVRTMSFSIYAQCRELYAQGFRSLFGPTFVLLPEEPDSPSPTPASLFRSLPTYFLAGFTSGGFIALFSCPFEFTKLSTQIELLMARAAAAQSRNTTVSTLSPGAQSQSVNTSEPINLQPKGALQSAKEIVSKRGLLGLYSGFRYHFARDALGTSLYFTVYESSKQLFSMYNPTSDEPGPLVIAISGGLCGVFSWALLFPIDTMKSIVQRDILMRPPGAPATKRNFSVFHPRMYRGLGVSIARTGLVNMTFFSIYEPLFKRLSSGE